MMRPIQHTLFVFFLLPAVAPLSFAQRTAADLDGTWQGTLTALGGMELTIVFHLKRGDTGSYTATMDSPDQGAAGIPVGEIILTGDSLRLKVPVVSGIYKGEIQPDARQIEGTWFQFGHSFPLTLERVPAEEAASVRRPQEPEPPFPYATKEVTFENEAAGVTLAGTLTIPQGEGPHPAVVLISGSGPQDRNSTLMGHKPFLLWANVLTRRGIAVLRYDDRGVSGSTGNWAQTTLSERAADVQAALDFLRSRSDIATGEIGLLGHSGGALVAPIVAAHSDSVDFLVLLSVPAMPGDELLARQSALIFKAKGMSAEGAAAYKTAMPEALEPLLTLPPDKPLPDGLRHALRDDFRAAAEAMSPNDRAVYAPMDPKAFSAILDRLVDMLTMPWMRGFLRYDPRPALRQVKAPVLAVYGAKDLQVSPEQNAPVLRQALEGNPDVTVKVLPGLNHLLQLAETGLPSEYGQIETTIAPKVLGVVSRWIAAHTAAEGNDQ